MALSVSNRGEHGRRFIKFCIVGASSVVVQLTTMKVYEHVVHSASPQTAWWGNNLGVMLAICNGFVWNRLWTFGHGGTKGAGGQFGRFVAVNFVGLGLQSSLFFLFHVRLRLFASLSHSDIVCSLMAIGIVTFWNFYANSRWTFRTTEPS
jgi:dolichol-phosphate mannosyltransferase